MLNFKLSRDSQSEQNRTGVAFPTSGVLLFSLLLLAAILYIIRYQTAAQTGVTGDDARYLVLAESFLKGQPYQVISYPDAPLETVWPPGYSLLILAPAGLLLGLEPEIVRATSIVLACLNVMLTYYLLKAYVDGRWSLIIVTGLFTLNHWVAGLAGMMMSETAFMTFVLLTLLLLQQWFKRTAKGERGTIFLLLAGLTQAAAVLIRYQGIALIAATALWLLSHKKWRPTILLVAITTLACLPFLIFMASNSIASHTSVFAVEMIIGQIATLWTRFAATTAKYMVTIPLVMIPLLGPRVLEQAQTIGTAWLVDGFHLAIFVLVSVGVLRGLRHRELLAFYAVTYLGMIILVDNQGGLYANESRYSAMLLPATYLYLWRALAWIASLIRLPQSTVRVMGSLVSLGLLAILLGRNLQQARASFPVADLSAGATWIQIHAEPDAIIMTHDPVERYIYLRRHTIPISQHFSDLITDVDTEANYVLIAPPLRLPAASANITRQLDPRDENILLPSLNDNRQRYEMVWKDSTAKTTIFRVLK